MSEYDVYAIFEVVITVVILVACIVGIVLGYHYKQQYDQEKTYRDACEHNPRLRYEMKCGNQEECILSCIKAQQLKNAG